MKHRLLGLIIIALALLQTLSIEAQRPFATLEHEGTVTAYYGTTALSQAHSAAVAGDIITLSPGMFTAVNITKAITIRGAGMFADTVTGTTPTYIRGEFTFSAPNDTLHYLSFEGLYFIDKVKYGSVYNPMFSKCMFRTELEYATATNNTTYMRDATFVNCIIKRWTNISYSGNYNTYTASGTTFLNCVILQSSDDSRDILTNCIASFNSYYCDFKVINNCILYDFQTEGSAEDAITSWNSIGIRDYSSSNKKYFHPSMHATHNLHNYYNYNSVFKYFNGDGSYIDGMSFELQDSIANTILGNDGTQVGIYGGVHPFNPRVQNYKITVPSESNASGQLPVTIQAANEN